MKILRNKTYQGMVDVYNGLLEENKKLRTDTNDLYGENNVLKVREKKYVRKNRRIKY